MAPLKATPKQILARRLAAQSVVHRPRGAAAALDGWALQDSPPGAAATAVLARSTAVVSPTWLDDAIADRSVIALYNARTATSVVPAAGAAGFGTALLPTDPAGLKAVLGNAVPKATDDLEATAQLAVDAVGDALDGRELSRDDLHQSLRERLPDELLPWCEGCRSHHARRGLLVVASLSGRLCVSGRAGRQPVFARTDQWATWKPAAPATARAQLVRRYLHWFGPTTVEHLAAWAGLAKPHAASLWATTQSDLVAVDASGTTAWLHADDEAALRDADPAAVAGVRLIGPGDPLLQAKDRAVLVDDPAVQKRLWTAIPTTGLVLDGTTAVATWKAKKAGKRLAVTATALGRRKPDLADEAERLAETRGCTSASVEWA